MNLESRVKSAWKHTKSFLYKHHPKIIASVPLTAIVSSAHGLYNLKTTDWKTICEINENPELYKQIVAATSQIEQGLPGTTIAALSMSIVFYAVLKAIKKSKDTYKDVKPKSNLDKIYRFFSKNSGKIGISATLIASAYQLRELDFMKLITNGYTRENPYISNYVITMESVAACYGIFTYIASESLNMLIHLPLYVKSLTIDKLKNREAHKKKLEEYLNKYNLPFFRDALIEMYLNDKEHNRAFELIYEKIDLMDEGSAATRSLTGLSGGFPKRKRKDKKIYDKLIKKGQSSLEANLKIAAFYLFENKKTDALKFIANAKKDCEKGIEKIGISVLKAQLLDRIYNRGGSDDWKKVIEEITNVDGFRFKKLVDSKTEVLTLSPEIGNFLSNTFVFKRGTHKNVREEYLANSFAYRALEEHAKSKDLAVADFIKLASSISLAKIGSRTYHVTEQKPLKNLDELFKDMDQERKQSLIENALETSAKVHSIVNSKVENSSFIYEGKKVKLETYNVLKELTRKFLDRIGNNKYRRVIADKLTEIVNHTKDTENYVFDQGDTYLTNFLEDGTLVDFEKTAMMPPTLSIVTTLEDPSADGINKQKAISHYQKTIEKFDASFTFNENLYRNYTLINGLGQIGSNLNQGYTKKAKDHLRKVIEETNLQSLHSLGSSLTDYIAASSASIILS